MTFGHLLPGGRDPTAPNTGHCSLILPLFRCRHQLPAPGGYGDLCPPTRAMLEKSCEAPWALRGAGPSGSL